MLCVAVLEGEPGLVAVAASGTELELRDRSAGEAGFSFCALYTCHTHITFE